MFKSSKDKNNKESAVKNLTVIGAGTKFRGDITSGDDFRLDGEFFGDLVTKGKVVIGKSGYLKGNARGKHIVIEGKAKGDFTADTDFIIAPGGKLIGNIKTKHVNVMEHAFFDGNCIITSDEKGQNADKPGTSQNATTKMNKKYDSKENKAILDNENEQKSSSAENGEPEGGAEKAVENNGSKASSILIGKIRQTT